MNRLASLLVLIILASAISACGSAASDSGDGGGGGGGSLANGIFSKAIDTAVPGTGDFNLFRDTNIIAGSPFVHAQILYPATDIDAAGKISAIWFRYENSTSNLVTCSNITIKLAHTSQGALVTTGDMTPNVNRGSLVTTLQNAKIEIPAGTAGEFFEIRLTTPFIYNGVDNLVVDFTRQTLCDGNVGVEVRDTFNPTPSVTVNYSFEAGAPDTVAQSNRLRHKVRFDFAGGDNAITFKDSPVPGSEGGQFPFTDGLNQKVQLLYLVDEINGDGPITGIGFPVCGNSVSCNLPTTAHQYTVTVKLGHSSLSSLDTDFNANFDVGAPVTVAQNLDFTVPDGVPIYNYVWIPLTSGSFDYDNRYNLVVEVAVSEAKTVGDTTWQFRSTSGKNGIVFGQINADTGTVSASSYLIKLRFHGGTMGVVNSTSGPDTRNIPFSAADDPKQQQLYLATELGTGGTITELACRYGGTTPSTPTDYGNFEVRLGHTTLPQLTTSFGSNFDSGGSALAFNGTFTLPGNLEYGDWIRIPLTTSFAYDPGKNLVVQMASDFGGASHPCLIETGQTTRYAGRRPWNNVRSEDNAVGPNGGIDNTLADLQLWFSK